MPTMSVESEKVNGELELAAIPKNVPSLCIPRVFPNITSERVKAVFEQLGIGRVERVDVVVRTGEKGETLKRIFVHLEWNDSENAAKARQRLLCGNDIKVIYDEPWFWKISANRSTREPRREESRPQRQDSRPRRDEYQDSRRQYYDSSQQRQEVQQQMIRQPKRRIVKRQHQEPQYVEMPRAEFATAAVARPMSPHSPPPRDEEEEKEKHHTIQLLHIPRKATQLVVVEEANGKGDEEEN